MTENAHSSDAASEVEAIRRFYEAEPRTSEWLTVTQEIVDQFAAATGDRQWIHTDPVRASREGPFGTTIAHGFLTLSLLTQLSRSVGGAIFPPAALMAINYGLNRVRFPALVPVGSRIRSHCRLLDIAARSDGQYLVTTENTIEVENSDKPGLVAEWLVLLIFPAANSGSA